ncbi:MAG TPA: response regulator transcription factor [Clostridiales bacterium]|nr:response regulator transcription factor [Clostridiales bacterium]
MKIAICEDRKEDAKKLQILLGRYLQTQGFAAEVDFFESGEALLSNFKPGKYRIIFMDIFMTPGGLTGMDTAQKIHASDEEAAIIFTTTSEDFGIAGYDVAVYYIVKPVTETDFLRAMKKCQKQMERYCKALEIMVNRQLIPLRLHDIIYVEAQRKNCIFITTQGELRSNMVFDTLTATLSELPFLRCHRSYIVNLTHIQNIQEMDFITTTSHKIPISRSFLPKVQNQFQQFLKNELKN